MTAVGACFPKRYRLLQRQEFLGLSRTATVIHGRSFLIAWEHNQFGHPRLGITASRKSGTAVARNRVKRCIREFFRLHRQLLPDVDLNVIVRRQAADNSAAVLCAELQHAFQQIGLRACCHESS